MALVEQPQTEQMRAFVDEVLVLFAANPVNRDVALARCLFYLQRVDRIADALEGVLPQLGAMANHPVMSRVLGLGK